MSRLFRSGGLNLFVAGGCTVCAAYAVVADNAPLAVLNTVSALLNLVCGFRSERD